MSCVSAQVIWDHIIGKLEEKDSEDVVNHCMECDACGSLLSDLEDVLLEGGEMPFISLSSSRRRRKPRKLIVQHPHVVFFPSGVCAYIP